LENGEGVTWNVKALSRPGEEKTPSPELGMGSVALGPLSGDKLLNGGAGRDGEERLVCPGKKKRQRRERMMENPAREEAETKDP